MAASYGTYSKLGIGTTSTVDKRIRFKQETFVAKGEVLFGEGITGTLDSQIEFCRNGAIRVAGPVEMTPNAVELSYLLEWIMGGTPTGTPAVAYPLTQANTLPEKYVTIDRVAKVFTYDGVKVSKATFKASQGGPLDLSLDLIGKTETVATAGSFPAISINTGNGPFIFQDLVLSIGGTTVKPKELTVTVDNMLTADRFLNSQTVVTIDQPDRKITLDTMVPYGDYYAIYSTLGASGLAAVATFTNAGAVLIISLTKVAIPAMTPNVPGKSEVMLRFTGDVYASGATPSASISLNPGP